MRHCQKRVSLFTYRSLTTRFTRATRCTCRTSTHALVARFKLSALLAHLTTKTLPTLIVVGLEVPVLAPAERPLPFTTSLQSIVCFSRIARGTHHHFGAHREGFF